MDYAKYGFSGIPDILKKIPFQNQKSADGFPARSGIQQELPNSYKKNNMNKNKTFAEAIEDILEKNGLFSLSSKEIEDRFHPVCLDEMSTITYDNKDGGMCIFVNRSEFRKGNPYFKVVNHNSFDKATKIARISFLKPEYIIHKNRDGKENWGLNNKEKRQLEKLLNEKYNNRFSTWQYAMARYNVENRLIRKDDEIFEKNLEDVKNIETEALPHDLPIPDYMKLQRNY